MSPAAPPTEFRPERKVLAAVTLGCVERGWGWALAGLSPCEGTREDIFQASVLAFGGTLACGSITPVLTRVLHELISVYVQIFLFL